MEERMTQAQEAVNEAANEAVELTFKRFILHETRCFAHEPEADLFRVNLLGRMLNRYDELRNAGLNEVAASARVRREFHGIEADMREMGFEEYAHEEEFGASRWPQMTEDEAAQYIRERDLYLHRQSLGVAMCSGCITPVMIGAAFSEWLYAEFFAILGMVGMFSMIALGVYSIVIAKKPKKEKEIKQGRFSLGSRLRKKLTQLREAAEEKARRRKGKGIAMIVGSIVPIFISAAFSEIWYGDFWPILGVAGMFVMIAAGVYELVMADGEKKTMKRLLDR